MLRGRKVEEKAFGAKVLLKKEVNFFLMTKLVLTRLDVRIPTRWQNLDSKSEPRLDGRIVSKRRN